MTVQVLGRTGGRRFGPTALAEQARRVAIPQVVAGERLVARTATGANPGVGALGRASGRVSGSEGMAPDRVVDGGYRRRSGELTRPRGAAVPRLRPAVATGCDGETRRGTYRLGRWERLAMTIIVTAAIIVGTLTVLLRPSIAPTRLVTVQPGDTVISIALRDLPGWDVSRAVDAIESLNDLGGLAVPVGTVLRIPGADDTVAR